VIMFDTLKINYGSGDETYKINRESITPTEENKTVFLNAINNSNKPISFGYNGNAYLPGKIIGKKSRTIIQSIDDIDINTYPEALQLLKYKPNVIDELKGNDIMNSFRDEVWKKLEDNKLYSLVILVLSLRKNGTTELDYWINDPANNTPPTTTLGYKYGIPRDIVITLNQSASMRSKMLSNLPNRPRLWGSGSKTKKYRKRVTNRYRGNNRNCSTTRYRRNRTRR